MSEHEHVVDPEFDFSNLTLYEKHILGPDGENYTLKEANGRAAKIYNNARIAGVTLGDSGKAESITGIGDLEPLLVSLCLFGDEGRPIQQAVVEKWSYQVVKKLHDKIKEVSNLDEQENPIKEAIEKALERQDSPIALDDFCSYIKGLNNPEVKPLQELLKDVTVKNLPISTTNGSE